MTYRNLNIDWDRKEELHDDYRVNLKNLAYERKSMGDTLVSLFRKRKAAKIEHKKKHVEAKEFVRKVREMSKQLADFTQEWIEDGNTEENLFLYVEAYELLLKYAELRTKQREVFQSPKLAKAEFVKFDNAVKEAEQLIRTIKQRYRNIQRSIDENSTVYVIKDYIETPSEEVKANVGTKKHQLSIKRKRHYPTKSQRFHKLADGWYPVTKDKEYGPKLNTVQVAMIESQINKFTK